MSISDWSADVWCSVLEELVRVPGGGKRTGLHLAVTDDAGDDDVRVVERRSEGVGQRVAELSALVDRTRHLRRDVARDAAGEGELPEQLGHAPPVATQRRVVLRPAALEPGVGDHRRAPVARAGDVDPVEVRSEEHTSELQSLMRNSYAVFCLKKKKKTY